MDIEKIIAENQGTIVDVRSYGEFMGGNVAGSINIPLNEILERIAELKKTQSSVNTMLCFWKPKRSSVTFPFAIRLGML